MRDIIINNGVNMYQEYMNPTTNEAFPGIFKYEVPSADGDSVAFEGLVKFIRGERYFLGQKFIDMNAVNSGKRFRDWKVNKYTQEMIRYLKEKGIIRFLYYIIYPT